MDNNGNKDIWQYVIYLRETNVTNKRAMKGPIEKGGSTTTSKTASLRSPN